MGLAFTCPYRSVATPPEHWRLSWQTGRATKGNGRVARNIPPGKKNGNERRDPERRTNGVAVSAKRSSHRFSESGPDARADPKRGTPARCHAGVPFSLSTRSCQVSLTCGNVGVTRGTSPPSRVGPDPLGAPPTGNVRTLGDIQPRQEGAYASRYAVCLLDGSPMRRPVTRGHRVDIT